MCGTPQASKYTCTSCCRFFRRRLPLRWASAVCTSQCPRAARAMTMMSSAAIIFRRNRVRRWITVCLVAENDNGTGDHAERLIRRQSGLKQGRQEMTKSVALVLGSGGARGYAHIGVIEEIERRGYSIECIAGCSMGAVVGGIYAAGGLPAYRDWVSGLAYLDVLRLLDFGFGNLGAIRGERIFSRIHEIVGDVNIEDLRIPFTAVATDLTNQQEVWFQQGSLQQAMRASAAIPSLFSPVRQGSRVLVDGGLLNPLPIIPVVSAHCDLIMAVNLNSNHTNGYALPVIERPAPIRQQWDQWMETLSWRNLLHKGNEEEEGDPQGQLEYLTEEISPAEAAANRQEDEAQPVQADIQ